jgi:hypothetical protein
MNSLDAIFNQYDKLIGGLSTANQAFISLLLLLFLLWQIYMIIKSGHWIFILALILFLPGTWPATRYLGSLLFLVIKLLFVRVGLLFF